MKNILIFASVVSLAVAGPHHRGLVDPGAAGPAPAPENKPIDFPQPVLPEIVLPVRPSTIIVTPVKPPPVIVNPVPVAKPVVQIIVNINGQQGSVPGIVVPKPPVEVVPIPGDIADSAPGPVEIGPAIVPEPVEIGPEISPEPVEIGIPVLPYPAEILPENLN